jgi:LPS-assembly protein
VPAAAVSRRKPRLPLRLSGYFLITITLLAARGNTLCAQQMTLQAPQAGNPHASTPIAPETVQSGQLPDAPSQVAYPTARVVPPPPSPDLVDIQSRGPQSYQAGIYNLDQDVVITWKDRRAAADHILYNSNTGELTLTGHVVVDGGANHEHLTASRGTYNLRTATGRFYDVSGSYRIVPSAHTLRTVFTTDNPFLFTGRIVIKTAPESYEVYEGTFTSCMLPDPDWIFSAAHISLDNQIARARDSTFHLLNVPVLFLPYATHPATEDARQTGFLIPTLGISNQKGLILGEEVYFAINRSVDLRLGAAYYSSIGWAQNGTLRYRGAGLDFATLHYSAVLDRRSAALQQGGQEVVFAARHDLAGTNGDQTRVAANIDYLSSYIYREAFSDTFNQAVTSDIVSTAYLTHLGAGFEAAAFTDRYQGIKVVATPQQQVHLFHVPTLLFDSTDHLIPATATPVSKGVEISFESSASGLKRTQPNFVTGGIVERLDLHPQASYPILLRGWSVVPAIAGRETLYSRSRAAPVPGQPPTQSNATLSRADFEFSLDLRPPVVERTFHPSHMLRLLGSEVRHTFEPAVTYRLVDGVNDFASILRFDATDVVSNTNEVEYSATQRIYRKAAANTSAAAPCQTQQIAHAPGFSSDAPNSADDFTEEDDQQAPVQGQCPSEELISWRLSQKYFFDPTFGGAVVGNSIVGRRNIFSTTLDLSGVAFITAATQLSPLISRLRLRTSAHTDVEWDFDLDTGQRKFNSSNVYVDLHQGNRFAAFSYARLDAPGRFYTESPDTTNTGVVTSISDFNQLRLLAGYGSPTKPGFSLAANAGIDLKALYGATSTAPAPGGGKPVTTTVYPALLQYATVQASYNWNCCGLAIEYRKLELGSVRNDGTYRFNFTLANIGAAGNLRRAERLF